MCLLPTKILPAVLIATIFGNTNGEALPNILWLTSEDNGPHLGCYGDRYATTPHLDALARKGLVYLHCWSNAPVCAPARTTLISGLYPTSTGAEHMRSMVRLPSRFRLYPQYLRDKGYYCTNNRKEDYNVEKVGTVWDDSSPSAHWKNRRPGQPFFAIFNCTVTHESRIRKRPHDAVHDPAQVRIPAYHPDSPEVRQDWAQYYDKLTEMDELIGAHLRELQDAQLADQTVIFYYGDHGPGMPRSKRWPYNSGLHVPLIVHIPPKFEHLRPPEYTPGGKTDRLVSFVDFAPTLLSLIGMRPLEHMQGSAFLGAHVEPPQPYLFGFRGRMDERYDLVRTVRDKRYVYIRNFMPHKIYGQHVSYMFQTPTTRVWKRMYEQQALNSAQSRFWQTKASEELYDLVQDPDEVNNLVDDPDHQRVLTRMRHAQREHAIQFRDIGFLPEDEIHSRSSGQTPYELARDSASLNLSRVIETAELATRPEIDLGHMVERLRDPDSAVRYWAALGLQIHATRTADGNWAALTACLRDPSPSVQVIAARTLTEFSSSPEVVKDSLDVLLRHADLTRSGVYVSMLALNALDELDSLVLPVKAQIESLPRHDASLHPRTSSYVKRLLDKTLLDLN